MGNNIVFYLDSELIEKVKNEENRSALVSSLLREHYSKGVKETIEDKTEKIEKELSELDKLKQEEEKLDREKIKLIEAQRKQSLIDSIQKKVLVIKNLWLNNFNERLPDEKAFEYIDLINNNLTNYTRIIEDEIKRRKELNTNIQYCEEQLEKLE